MADAYQQGKQTAQTVTAPVVTLPTSTAGSGTGTGGSKVGTPVLDAYQNARQTVTLPSSGVSQIPVVNSVLNVASSGTPKMTTSALGKVSTPVLDSLGSKNQTVSTPVLNSVKTAQSHTPRTWLQSGALGDGVTAGNIGKAGAGTRRDIQEDLTTGLLKLGEGAIDTTRWLGAFSYGGLTPNEDGTFSYSAQKREQDRANAMEFINRDLIDEEALTKKIYENQWSRKLVDLDTEKASLLGDKSDALVQSAGQLAGTAALSAAGIPWFMTTGLTTFGGELENAVRNGATFDQAGVSAAVSTAAEILTEKIGGISYGGKTLSDAVSKKFAKAVSNKVANAVLQLGLDAAGEGLEEVISGAASAVGQKLTYASDAQLSQLFSSEDALESFIGGAILGGFGGVNNIVQNRVSTPPMAESVTSMNQENMNVTQQAEHAILPTQQQTTPGVLPVQGQKNTAPDVGAETGAARGFATQDEIAAIQSINGKSVREFTPEEMATTEKLAQRYWEELGEKSPFYRAQNGEWRDSDQTPVQIANQEGSRKGVQKNEDTGWNINVSGKVFNESRHKGRVNQASLPYLSYINDIVRKAVLVDSETMQEGKAKSANSMMMHSFYGVADIGNGPELVKLYVEEMNDPNSQKTAKRAYQLQNIEKAGSLKVQGSGLPLSPIIQTASIKSVADLFKAVKGKDAKSKLGGEFLPGSQVVDAENATATQPASSAMRADQTSKVTMLPTQTDATSKATTLPNSGTRQSMEEIAAGIQSNSRNELNKKAQQVLKRIERGRLTKLKNALGADKFTDRSYLQDIVREISDEYLNTGRVASETIDRLFNSAYQQGIRVEDTFYNENKHIKDYIRGQKVSISEEDVRDIPDWNLYRKSLFGTLTVAQDGLPVDTMYQELNGMNKALFPDEITHPADQLQRIADVARSIQKIEKNLDEYYGKNSYEFYKWAKNDFDTALREDISELRNVKRYAQEKAQAKEQAQVLTDQSQVEQTYQKMKDARKALERVQNRNLLTERDKVQVTRLLKGEIEVSDLKPGQDNVRGIKEVYEAQKEYEQYAKTIRDWNASRRSGLRAEADELLTTANDWKDKRAGILYSRETMERNVRDIVKDPEVAEKVIDTYFTPVHEAQADATRLKNQYRERVRKLDLSTKETKAMQERMQVSEAHAVQLLGEAMDNIAMLQESKGRMQERDGMKLEEWEAVVTDLWHNNPQLDRAKIEGAVEEFRRIYDELFQMMNESRVRNGYEPVNYRKGYFPHFQASEDGGILGLFGKALGITTDVANLPTTINGLTHTFKPGIRWFGNALERTGFDTVYDAVLGFDRYIEGVADVIYQTDNIQKLRALATQIRYRTGDEGLREQVDAVDADMTLNEQDKQDKIKRIYEDGRYALSNFVVELEEYTNLLANKKSRADRNMEQALGRDMYNLVKGLESRVAANMVAINPGSWLTNFIPLTQGWSTVGSRDILGGIWQTLRSIKESDGIVGASTFLTNRRGSDPLTRTWAQKTSAVMSKPMEWIDNFVADSLVRARYGKNLRQGMSEDAAMKDADAWTAGVMADRSKGATPTIFNRSNPITKLFTQFQTEVNNQYSYLFKDVPRDVKEKGLAALAGALLKFAIGAWFFDEVYEYFIGRRPALDPIGILNDTVGDLTGYELPNLIEGITGLVKGEGIDFTTEKVGLTEAGVNLAEAVAEELPFVGGLLGGGRLPVSSALPNVGNLWKAVTEEDWSAEKKWSTAGKELIDPAAYLLLPFGGGQLKKIAQGHKAVREGGSYNVDAQGEKQLQYPVFNDSAGEKVGNLITTGLFGKTSLPTGQEWIVNDFPTLGVRQTKAYQALTAAGVKGEQAWGIIQDMKNAESDAAKREVLSKADLSDGEKKAVYQFFFGDKGEDGTYTTGRDDEMEALAAAGLDMSDFLTAQNQYSDINKRYRTASEKALEFSRWVNEQDYSEKQKAALKDAFTYFSQIPAASSRYDGFVEAGLSDNDAYGLTQAIAALTPAAGKETVSNAQKWRAVVGYGLSTKDQLTALQSLTTESQYQKFETANSYGVTPEKYVTVYETLPKYDANGNGSYTNAEVKAAIDSFGTSGSMMPGSGKLLLSVEQKAVLWQLLTGSSSAKNNPYSTSVGAKVLGK